MSKLVWGNSFAVRWSAKRWRSLDLVDGPLRWHKVNGVWWGHVEGLGFPVQTGALAGYTQAALAGGDDFCDELLAVHADLHGNPVLSHFLGQLQLVLWTGVLAAMFRQPPDRRTTKIRTEFLRSSGHKKERNLLGNGSAEAVSALGGSKRVLVPLSRCSTRLFFSCSDGSQRINGQCRVGFGWQSHLGVHMFRGWRCSNNHKSVCKELGQQPLTFVEHWEQTGLEMTKKKTIKHNVY